MIRSHPKEHGRRQGYHVHSHSQSYPVFAAAVTIVAVGAMIVVAVIVVHLACGLECRHSRRMLRSDLCERRFRSAWVP